MRPRIPAPLRLPLLAVFAALFAGPAPAAQPPPFRPAQENPFVGDWMGRDTGYVAQSIATDDGTYRVFLLTEFDAASFEPLATLESVPVENPAPDTIVIAGDGWRGTLRRDCCAGTLLDITHDTGETIRLMHFTRNVPGLRAPPPPDAVILSDFADTAAPFERITARKFGDCRLHLEFRALGHPAEARLYLQSRYPILLNDSHARPALPACAAFVDCTPPGTVPPPRAARPPLEWQTLDIEFSAPRFDAAGQIVAPARATVRLNGVVIHDDTPLHLPAPRRDAVRETTPGPLMLETPRTFEFRNIWLAPRRE
ncbi:DUF1080 domain-containing protein [Termitidicoccus mucosus]|uniref:3-keto-alpha-glucoside-1,2-lyase/3-keto-2-hydroxy-glucal hydratase domain-containing protein n=1 Tax=Termitidicoccus mucosus TaxID=1184151 RepID=A0A178IM01_9BACT|nr:hypothetical protein AW736_00285 [Opitutaceae bacterium TSB47]